MWHHGSAVVTRDGTLLVQYARPMVVPAIKDEGFRVAESTGA
jgi:hypothetical protein